MPWTPRLGARDSIMVRKWLELTKFHTLSFGRKVWVVYVSLVLFFVAVGTLLAIGFDFGSTRLESIGTALLVLVMLLGIPKFAYMWLRYMWLRLLDLVTGNWKR